jgi:hypothetical protein
MISQATFKSFSLRSGSNAFEFNVELPNFNLNFNLRFSNSIGLNIRTIKHLETEKKYILIVKFVLDYD